MIIASERLEFPLLGCTCGADIKMPCRNGKANSIFSPAFLFPFSAGIFCWAELKTCSWARPSKSHFGLAVSGKVRGGAFLVSLNLLSGEWCFPEPGKGIISSTSRVCVQHILPNLRKVPLAIWLWSIVSYSASSSQNWCDKSHCPTVWNPKGSEQLTSLL